jgi:hypothetical protein
MVGWFEEVRNQKADVACLDFWRRCAAILGSRRTTPKAPACLLRAPPIYLYALYDAICSILQCGILLKTSKKQIPFTRHPRGAVVNFMFWWGTSFSLRNLEVHLCADSQFYLSMLSTNAFIVMVCAGAAKFVVLAEREPAAFGHSAITTRGL